MKSRLLTTGLKYATGLLLITACFLYFRYVVPYRVCFKEQIQLFVFGSSYIFSYFSKPAALACLIGDFLTQFLYFKTGAATVVTLLLIIEWRLVYMTLRRFQIKQNVLLWSLLPVIVECFSIPEIFFPLALPVSFILTLLTFVLYTKINARASMIAGIMLVPVLYIFAGFTAFLFLFLAILYDIHCRQRRFIYWAILTGLAIALPVIFRHIFLLTLKQAYFYPYSGFMEAPGPVFMALIVFWDAVFGNLFTIDPTTAKNATRRFYQAIAVAVPVLLIIGGYNLNKDDPQENLSGMMIEANHENWDKVLDIAEKTEMNSLIAACYTNIALSNKSLLGDRLMDFYQPFANGLIPGVYGRDWATIFASCDAYHHIGDMDMAQHAAMVGMISSPNQRSVRMVERLAEINQATGDMPAAAKYLRILESTLFHKRGEEAVKNQPIQDFFKEDILRKSTDIKASLELLTESNPDNLPAVNYLLCYYLLTKDIPAFFEAYTNYGKEKYVMAPKVYAEALLIYFAAVKSPVEELAAYGIHPEIIQAFTEYTRLYEKSEGKLAPVQEKFPNTYWLFYHFASKDN